MDTYPHLKPLMKDENRYLPVYIEIRGSYPAMQERCVYFKRKNKLDQWYDVNLFEPFDGTYGVRLNEEDVIDPMAFLA